MNAFLVLLGFLLGLVFGGGATYIIISRLKQKQTEANQALITQAKTAFSEAAATSFKSLSMEVLAPITDQLTKTAGSKLAEQQAQATQTLEGKKELIDQALTTMNTELSKVATNIQELKEKGENQFGGITQQLSSVAEQTNRLTGITSQLKEALASGKTRGEWGERIAEDILRVAGFKEKFDYVKQTEESSGSRPDFTFFLPKELRLNMDVKFPLSNYMSYIKATSEEEKATFTKRFLFDVRARVKEISTREYINVGAGTVNCVLLFIPIETVFGFIQEADPELLDMALRQHVIMCSPFTLFAVLAIINQATSVFSVQQNVDKIAAKYSEFEKQWRLFCEKYEKLEKNLQGTEEAFRELAGIRTNKLDGILEAIKSLKERQEEEVEAGGVEALPEKVEQSLTN